MALPTTRPHVWVGAILLPVIALGATITMPLALWIVYQIPVPAGSRELVLTWVLFQSVFTAVVGAAPWWLPVAYLYRRRALLFGAIVGLAPAMFRLAFSGEGPLSTVAASAQAIEAAGVVAASALGAHVVARRLSANNSSKPTPLRGAA